MGDRKIGSSLSLLSLFKKARSLFAAVYPRNRVGAANQGTASNNLAPDAVHGLDAEQGRRMGARRNRRDGERGSKSFFSNQSERGAHGKTGFRIPRRGYTETDIFCGERRNRAPLRLALRTEEKF